jgi:hypothetical protein
MGWFKHVFIVARFLLSQGHGLHLPNTMKKHKMSMRNTKYQMQNQIPQAINNIENAISGRFCESKAKNKLCFYFL